MAGPARSHLVRILPSAPHGGVEVYALQGARTTLGSAATCSVTLPDLAIAPQHLRLDRSRSGPVLRATTLDDEPAWIDGRPVPAAGADVPPDAVIRLGGVLLLHRQWTDEEAAAASLPPLPGPVNSCHPTVVDGMRRLQAKRHSGGTFWIVGEEGCGRSVVIDHLRALMEESSGRDWITGGPSLEAARQLPAEADPERTLCIPPLRDRGEDLLVLMTSMNGGALPRLTPELVEALLLYDWPGNIRELRLFVARAHDSRFGAASQEQWDVVDFPDVKRYADELTGRQDPITLQVPERQLPRTEPEMRVLLDAHWWRVYPLAAATGQTRSKVLRHVFGLGIREPWRRH
jgi:energy-coupling factor transporter ATP-binding protein EcfA2